MNASLIEHRIFAQNLLLGESLFITLRLPEEWELAPGVSRPEVHATHERAHRRWVASGDAWYVVYHKGKRWAMEVAISSRPLNNRKKFPPPSAETAPVSTHTASVRWRTRRRGLPWRRHDVTFLTVEFACPETERALKIEFSGWCPPQGFEAMLTALAQSRCH